MAAYQVSVTMACKVCSISQSAYYYEPVKKITDEDIAKSLKHLASEHPRWGFNKMCGRKFRTLNIIDDYNREALPIAAHTSLPAQRVTQHLDKVALIRGYPEIIRVDNGPEFLSSHFKKWAEEHQILIHYIQPGKPAQNGFIERFNRTYREEVLDGYLFDNLHEVRQVTEQWLLKYKEERPHESLGNQSPIQFAKLRKTRQSINKNDATTNELVLNYSTFDLS